MTEQNVRDGDPSLELPDEEEIEKTTEETRVALEKLVQSKIAAAQPVRAADKQAPAQYIRFVFASQLS
jgi:SNW domain-containing protein 1